jgi:hypothetical protein
MQLGDPTHHQPPRLADRTSWHLDAVRVVPQPLRLRLHEADPVLGRARCALLRLELELQDVMV